MVKIIGYRLGMAIPLVLIVALIVFVLESLVPGNTAETILGSTATPQAVASLTRQLGLDHPWYSQYWEWLHHLLEGNLGQSVLTDAGVGTTLRNGVGVTLSLVALSVALSAIAGTALGVLSAMRGGWLGRVIDVASLTGLAIPSFLLAVGLQWLFAVKLRLLPATGYVPLDASPWEWLKSLILPVAALSLIGVASVAKQARQAARDVLEADFIRVLRACGLSERRVILKHVVRNAAIPVMSVVGVMGAAMLGGTVFVEQAFALNGLGSIAATAASQHDIQTILGATVYFTVFVVGINLMVDVSYALLNPKVRVS